jgi:hypothetical protein
MPTPLPADAQANPDAGAEYRRSSYMWVVIPALLALGALGVWWLRRLPS